MKSNDYIKVSVCMATYNGEKYIKTQLDSIIKNLNDGDEIIISDDNSVDSTWDIINSYKESYDFIKVMRNKHDKGVIGNFETALENCSNELIFLSDQDDKWAENKRETLIKIFNENECDLVLHNANIWLENEDRYEDSDLYSKLGFSTSLFRNLLKNTYIGCCMAFRKELITTALPFPEYKDMHIHDWWIAICALKTGKVLYCKDKLIDYRIHNNNTLGFKKTSLKFKIIKRVRMIKLIIKEAKRFTAPNYHKL